MTIEVEASWLVPDEGKTGGRASKPPGKPRQPPPIPGATKKAPPMPAAPPSRKESQRLTMEVKAEWLEDVTAAASEAPLSKKRTSAISPVAAPAKPRRGPPIPRED
jgi:hypothetical protein